MQSWAILPFAMGSPCQEMSRDHVIAVIAWLLCQWLQARRELQPYAPQILTLETKLTSTSVACMPGACLAHAWCMPGACLVPSCRILRQVSSWLLPPKGDLPTTISYLKSSQAKESHGVAPRPSSMRTSM